MNWIFFISIIFRSITGIKYNPVIHGKLVPCSRPRLSKGPIQRRLEKASFKIVPSNQNQDQILKDFLIKDLENFIAEINCGSENGGNDAESNVPEIVESTAYTLKDMPVRLFFTLAIFRFSKRFSIFFSFFRFRLEIF